MKSDISRLIQQGAIFFCSHSGGKDSQTMYNLLRLLVPHDQIVVVHADLGAVEWNGVQSHIRSTIAHPLNVVRAGKTFFDMVQRRHSTRPEVPCWPSSSTRQCTSDLKRDPIHKFIRQYLTDRNLTLGVNCTGIRAAESSARSKKKQFTLNTRLSKAGRQVYEWLPIFDLSKPDVFKAISDCGQKPFWIYKVNERASCVLCIMGSRNDLLHGIKQRPDLYRLYSDVERTTGWTLFPKQSLAEKAGLIPLLNLQDAA